MLHYLISNVLKDVNQSVVAKVALLKRLFNVSHFNLACVTIVHVRVKRLYHKYLPDKVSCFSAAWLMAWTINWAYENGGLLSS